jgi:hypothetical protein
MRCLADAIGRPTNTFRRHRPSDPVEHTQACAVFASDFARGGACSRTGHLGVPRPAKERTFIARTIRQAPWGRTVRGSKYPLPTASIREAHLNTLTPVSTRSIRRLGLNTRSFLPAAWSGDSRPARHLSGQRSSVTEEGFLLTSRSDLIGQWRKRI